MNKTASDVFRDAKLSTTVRDHKVIFTKKEMPPIWITEWQADSIRAHSGNWITIHADPLNPKSPILYDGKKINIDQIVPLDIEKVKEYQGLRYFCDFGESHSIFDECKCHDKYKCSGFLFSTYMAVLKGYVYMQDITKEDREKFISWTAGKKGISALLIEGIKKKKEEDNKKCLEQNELASQPVV